MKNDHLHLNAGRMLGDGGGGGSVRLYSMDTIQKDREKEKNKTQHNMVFTFVTVVISNSQPFFYLSIFGMKFFDD